MPAAINQQIDKAARVLNSMMDEIHQEAFVSGAVSEVTGTRLRYTVILHMQTPTDRGLCEYLLLLNEADL